MFQYSAEGEAEALCDILTALSARRDELAERFEELQAEDRDGYQRLEDEAADLNAWLGDTAEIVMVATYHWLERELKVMAAWLPGQTLKQTNRMNLQQLAATFAVAGYDLSTAPHYEDMDLLRVFANSWKHNALEPSDELIGKLHLAKSGVAFGLLSNREIEDGLRVALALEGEDVTMFDIVRAMVKRARDLLIVVAKNAPMRA